MTSVCIARSVQAIAEVVGPMEQIPRDGFKTWSLFLICTPDWIAPEKSHDLANLYGRFRGFGDAIGKDNLAVWFWKQRAALNDARLSENVDVARSAEYCGELQLRPSEGPYLVVTTDYPDLTSFPKDKAVFALGGLQPVDLAKMLNTLTDQLLLERKVDAVRLAATTAPAPPSDSGSPGLWIQLLEGARRTLLGLGCGVKMQISTGVLSAELRGCAAP